MTAAREGVGIHNVFMSRINHNGVNNNPSANSAPGCADTSSLIHRRSDREARAGRADANAAVAGSPTEHCASRCGC